MTLTRRTLLAAVPFVAFAPAIVRATSLMPVKAWRLPPRLMSFNLFDNPAEIIFDIWIKELERLNSGAISIQSLTPAPH